MESFGVLIAGGGIAGLYAALQFPKAVSVLLLTKGEAGVSGSALAQGGIAAVLEHDEDSYELHFADTMRAGGYKNNPAAVEQLIREGPDAVRDIIRLGVDFDAGEDGTLQKTLEGGHSRRRIMHRRDQTGAEIIRALWERVREKTNITVLEYTALCSLSPLPDGFCGQLSPTQGGGSQSVCAGFVILATGGIGQAYRYTTNPAISTGDGIRLAAELGAKIKNLHYVQFHPTAMPGRRAAEGGGREDSCFLVSEAVRGEGAVLLNRDGERFMRRYDERLELAPRDVVSRSIISESRRLGGDDRFYLDITARGSAWLSVRFPAIFAECERRGLDMGRDRIPVFPCQHYLMGGIDVDLDGKTTVPRLYAAGECAHTGLHGANRLASNSLPEALVWGKHAAQNIMRCIRSDYAMPGGEREGEAAEAASSGGGFGGLVDELRGILQKSCFVFADKPSIPAALERVEEIREEMDKKGDPLNPLDCQARSIAFAAKLILEGNRDEH
ncbi:MAG: FAD-binding protein [Clostridium sp.]|jgi:L-aspartate oxidase|nr:FAD-binding protein [Clostridium sp.]